MNAAAVDRTHEVTAFGNACVWTGVRADDRPAWLGLRRTMLTASDMAAVLGEDEHRSPLDVYVDKVTERKEPERIGLDDPRFWGTVLEQPVLRAVADFHGWKYRQGGALLRSRKHPILGCTLDAEIDMGDGIWVDFEGKTTRVPKGWDEEIGALPDRVLIQVQTQLLITGAALAVVFALLQGSRPVTIPIEPAPKFHEVLVERAELFMEQVRALCPPPPSGKPGDTKALARLHPAENGSAVALPIEAIEWTREYQKIAEQLRGLERRKEHYAQLLKNAIGPATWGVLPDEVGGKRCWRWATQKRAEYHVEATTIRALTPLKEPPEGCGPLGAANDTLIERLETSIANVADAGNAGPIRFGGRRRTKR